MYYVCSNIVKPLTEPFKLSFSELVGPTQIQWFVSHYWGMPIRHFGHAIRKHAQSQEDWRESSYWICTFSNSQWHVKLELGSGRWQDSSFYLALRIPSCKGTLHFMRNRSFQIFRFHLHFSTKSILHFIWKYLYCNSVCSRSEVQLWSLMNLFYLSSAFGACSKFIKLSASHKPHTFKDCFFAHPTVFCKKAKRALMWLLLWQKR